MNYFKRFSLPFLMIFGLGFGTCAARQPEHQSTVIREAMDLGPELQMEAISKLETYIQEHPNNSDIPDAMLYAGELRRLGGDNTRGHCWFASLAEQYPTHSVKNSAILGMAVIDSDKKSDASIMLLQRFLTDEAIPDTMNSDRYRILAIHSQLSHPKQSKSWAKKAWAFGKNDPSTLERLQKDLAWALEGKVAKTLPAEEPSSARAEQSTYLSVLNFKNSQSWSALISKGELFLKTWPDSPHHSHVSAMVKKAKAGDPFNKNKVGVLLPLSGKYAPAAASIRQSMEFTIEQSGLGLELIFKDTQGTEETTIQAIEELVTQSGVSAIIGPLLKDTVMPAAHSAQDFEVPLIVLARSQNPTDVGDYIFRSALSMEGQVSTLIEHAMGDGGWSRFAIMAPDTPYGNNARELFANQVKSSGGEVVRTVIYSGESTDFLPDARTMGQKIKATDDPVIDFDAIFIPDNHRHTPLVVSALAYEEFPVGTFRPYPRAKPIYVLGLNGWNSPQIVKTGAQYMTNGVFVDAFWNKDDNPNIQSFTQKYKSSFNRTPGIYDALVNDTIRLLSSSVSLQPENRSQTRDNLLKVTITDPLTGGNNFSASRELNRSLQVLVIKPSGIKKWIPPEESEQ